MLFIMTMFSPFKKFFSSLKSLSPDIAIDLGTANTLVYVSYKGIVLNEPSIVALKLTDGSMIPYAFGNQAKLMVGKTPNKIRIIRPLKDGVIADFKAAEEMIRNYVNVVRKAETNAFFSFIKPRIIVCVPSTSTSVERRAIQDAAESAGAREAYLIEEPMAAAIGAGLKVTDPSGFMVVDIGGGTTEIAVISLGGVVYGNSLRVGGDKMDEDIILYIKRRYNLLIGESTSERIKLEIGCAKVDDEQSPKTMIIRGRSILDGIPREMEISELDIAEALKDSVGKIIQDIKIALENTPPELSADIVCRGIIITGGGALLKNLDKAVSESVKLKVYVADNPLECVVRGTGIVLENIQELGNVLFRQE